MKIEKAKWPCWGLRLAFLIVFHRKSEKCNSFYTTSWQVVLYYQAHDVEPDANPTAMNQLLKGNHDWAEEMLQQHKEWFEEHAHEQHPEFLFITCCDSRIAPYAMTKTLPGRMFVYRTIGNIVKPEEAGTRSVLDYAIEVLGIRKIIVCGHYDCGAIHAALHPDKQSTPAIQEWLGETTEIAQWACEHNPDSNEQCLRRLEKENVKQQADKLMAEYPDLDIVGWYFDIRSGEIEELC